MKSRATTAVGSSLPTTALNDWGGLYALPASWQNTGLRLKLTMLQPCMCLA